MVARMAMRKIIHILRTRGRLRMRLVIVGTNGEAHSIARTLQRNRWLGYDAVGFVRVSNGHPETPADLREKIDGIPVIGWTRRITEAVHAAGADMVLIANSDIPPEKLPTIYRDLQDEEVEVRISAGILNIAASRMSVEPLDGFPVLALRQPQLPRSQAVLKRAFDAIVSSLLSLAMAPLLLVVAIAIKLDSAGPVFFRQERVGQGGRRFRMLKFRSMYTDAEHRLHEVLPDSEADGILFKIKDDPRVTRIGRIIRKWSIDELPQLFNVVRGQMSLVGPRPPLPREVEQYDRWLRGRLHVKPGITGLWQVNGRHELTFEDYVRYDLFYVRNWSLALDVSILWRTIPAVLSRRGSY
jgi:exopolysaccharide biosynthesis polyprenyl glycosylphosphotransferase